MEKKELGVEQPETKVELTNRAGEKMFALVREAPDKKGYMIINPGWGGNKEQAQLVALSEVAFNNGYTSIRFDQTNNNGESAGAYEQATVTGYKADLEDVIAWAKKQGWYREPFIVAGHSLGGMTSLLYAEQNPDLVKGLVTIAPPLSGKRYQIKKPDEFAEWQKNGVIVRKLGSKEKQVPWSHMADRMKYDVLKNTEALQQTPALLVVGEKDTSNPVDEQELLAQHLPESTLVVVPGAEHTLRKPEEIEMLKKTFAAWLHQL